MAIAIDSQILIFAGYGRKKALTQELKQLKKRSTLLLKRHEEQPIILPMVAVAELLVPIPATQHTAALKELQSQYVCYPLDLHVASIAAGLWANYAQNREQLGYQGEGNRIFFKADILIVATALAAGATCFYTHDKSCRALGSQVMQCLDLPHLPPNLFANQDSEEED